jgi:ADP-ribose pyrophosphatase YjhB (NUDIX family)
MDDITPRKRPRVIVLGILLSQGKLLVSAVTEANGRVKGWRALGGGVEFGERVEDALRRELAEEIDATIVNVRRLAVLENHFDYRGQQGHEIVFVMAADLNDPGKAKAESFFFKDGSALEQAKWTSLQTFIEGKETLFPVGILPILQDLLLANPEQAG